MYEYRATCIRVVGPLSVSCEVDLGFHTHIHATLRLADLNQPTSAKRGKTVTTVKDWIAVHDPFTVQTFANRREKFGRFVAKFVGDDGSVLNDILLKDKLVTAYEGGRRGEHGAPASHEEKE